MQNSELRTQNSECRTQNAETIEQSNFSTSPRLHVSTSKYTPESALENVKKHSTYRELDNWVYVLQGSCGNKVLGQISYLRKYTDTKIEIITPNQFEIIK